jgi:hypothetical protein
VRYTFLAIHFTKSKSGIVAISREKGLENKKDKMQDAKKEKGPLSYHATVVL